jgi:hypothetical protein
LSAKSSTLEPIFSLPNRGLELSCRPIVKPHFHASIRKMRLYGTQNGDFSPLFGPSSDFGLSATIPQSLEIGLDTGETGDGRDRFSWGADRPATRGISDALLPDCYPKIGSSGALATPVLRQRPPGTPLERYRGLYGAATARKASEGATRPDSPHLPDRLGGFGSPDKPSYGALQRFLRLLMQRWRRS